MVMVCMKVIESMTVTAKALLEIKIQPFDLSVKCGVEILKHFEIICFCRCENPHPPTQ